MMPKCAMCSEDAVYYITYQTEKQTLTPTSPLCGKHASEVVEMGLSLKRQDAPGSWHYEFQTVYQATAITSPPTVEKSDTEKQRPLVCDLSDPRDEPDFEGMTDDERLVVARHLVSLLNTTAYRLSTRKFWVQFEVRNRTQFPRAHDPQAVEMHVWQEL